MNAERWRQIEDLFQQALEVDTDHRLDFVHSAAREDSSLRVEVLTLLDAGKRGEEFLNQPIHGGVARMLSEDAAEDIDPSQLVGQRLGAYRLQSLIAVGGMGAVYLGVRDDEFNRTVAVKLVRRNVTGSSSGWRDDLRRRFQLERQVLANLDHPNIARLIDGGTSADGRPYLVMEHVAGLPIDVFCQSRKLSIDQRLRLFMDVCRAVQHAHQNLVIHRDLKPNNILVTDEGIPKLLDFGVAKLLAPHVAAAPRATVTGAFMGTFAYAAPEQISGSSGVMDTRSDVYALGLILYRLLTGEHAYNIDGPVSDVVRSITEVDPNPPSSHQRDIGGELDTIVLKALMKDQVRRYQSAGDLAADIDRYLNGSPILARGDSRWYNLRKTVRRYRVPLAFTAMLLAVLATFAIVASIQSRRLAQRGTALSAALHTSNIERGRLMGLSSNLAAAESLIWPEHLAHPDRLSHWALWEQYAWQPCLRSFRLHQVWGDQPSAISDHGGAGNSELATGNSLRPTADSQLPVANNEPPTTNDESLITLTGMGSKVTAAVVDWRNCRELWRVWADEPRSRLAISPDGMLIVIDHADGRLTQHQVAEVNGPPKQLNIGEYSGAHWIAISNNHQMLAMGRDDATVILSLQDGRVVHRINRRGLLGGTIAFSLDDQYLFEGSRSGVLRRISLADGSEVELGRGTNRGFGSITISGDGRYLAVDTDVTEISIVDLDTLAIVTTIKEPGGWPSSMAFQPHPDIKASRDQGIRGSSDQAPDASMPLASMPHALAPSPSALLAIATVDKVVRLVEVPSGRVILRLTGQQTIVRLCFSPSGDRLFTSGRDGVVRVWELSPWAAATRWGRQPGTIFNMRVVGKIQSPNGQTPKELTLARNARLDSDDSDVGRSNPLLAVCYGDTIGAKSIIQLLDAQSGEVVRTMRGHSDMISSIVPDPLGRHVITSSYDRTLLVWPLDHAHRDDAPRLLRRHVAPINAIALSPDGSRLAFASDEPKVEVLNVESGDVLAEYPAPGYRVPSIAWSADNRFIAFAALDPGRIELISVGDGRRRKIADGVATRIVRFSADGSLLAGGAEDGTVHIWDLAARPSRWNGVESTAACTVVPAHGDDPISLTLSGHQQDVFALDFSPDGTILASSGRSGEIRLWDVASGQCLAALRAHNDMVFSLEFLDDHTLLSGGREPVIIKWDLSYYDRHIEGNRAIFEEH